jgi:hypothetical protein
MRLDCTKLLKGMMIVKSSKHTMGVSLEWILSLLLPQEVLQCIFISCEKRYTMYNWSIRGFLKDDWSN